MKPDLREELKNGELGLLESNRGIPANCNLNINQLII